MLVLLMFIDKASTTCVGKPMPLTDLKGGFSGQRAWGILRRLQSGTFDFLLEKTLIMIFIYLVQITGLVNRVPATMLIMISALFNKTLEKDGREIHANQ